MTAPNPLSPSARPLDLSPLTQPVDDAALTAFIAESKAADRPWRRMNTGQPRPGVLDIGGQIVPVLVPVVALLFFLYVGGVSLLEAIGRFTLEAPFPLNLVIVGVLALILAAVLVGALQVVRTIRSLAIPRSWWETAYRITRLAAANDLRYGHDEVVSYPGVIFGTGQDRVAMRRLSSTASRPLEIGNYRYTVPSDDRENAQVHHWGYVAITLDRRLPHLLLDAQANNRSVFGIRTSNLPVDLAPDQRLSLGGEFDERFTLYAPSDYGRDAFYIFAPDLMALFIDRLGTFDVEIVDDRLFVYGSPFDLTDPATYAWLQEVVDTVLARTVRRTGRYTDDFGLLESDPVTQPRPLDGASPSPPPSPPGAAPVFAFGGEGLAQEATNTVAERGRRLRRRRFGAYTVIGLLVIAFWVYNEVVGPLFGLPVLKD